VLRTPGSLHDAVFFGIGPAPAHTRQLKGAGRKSEWTRRSVGMILPSYGRAKTSALLVGTPFCDASPCAGFEPFVTR